jgi:valyl-tRNA synthetase
MDISPGKVLPVLLASASADDVARATRHARLLQRVGRVESIAVLGDDQEAPPSATALLDDMRLLVPMAGLIDVAAERERLARQLERIDGDIARARGKLANAQFVANAPEAVVSKEKERLSDFERNLAQLNEQLARLDALN